MNYNSIDIDDEIAWVGYRNRGIFPMHAQFGEVIDKRKRKKWGNTSQTGEVLIRYTDKWQQEQTEWISAYNVIDHWDRYEEERDAILRRQEQERSEREARYESMRQQQERERLQRQAELERIQREKDEEKHKFETTLLINFNVPLGSLISVTDHSVTLTKDAFEKILSR